MQWAPGWHEICMTKTWGAVLGILVLGPIQYCIKLLPEKNSGYFNQSFVLINGKVNGKFMLTGVFRFYRSFFSGIKKFHAMGPWRAISGLYSLSGGELTPVGTGEVS